MSHDLDLPDVLDRKKNPQTPATIEERRAYANATAPAPQQRTVTKVVEEDEVPTLTPSELEELAEIRAMVKTNLVIAKRMASEWVQRAAVRKVQARRRYHLKTVKGLSRRA